MQLAMDHYVVEPAVHIGLDQVIVEIMGRVSWRTRNMLQELERAHMHHPFFSRVHVTPDSVARFVLENIGYLAGCVRRWTTDDICNIIHDLDCVTDPPTFIPLATDDGPVVHCLSVMADVVKAQFARLIDRVRSGPVPPAAAAPIFVRYAYTPVGTLREDATVSQEQIESMTRYALEVYEETKGMFDPAVLTTNYTLTVDSLMVQEDTVEQDETVAEGEVGCGRELTCDELWEMQDAELEQSRSWRRGWEEADMQERYVSKRSARRRKRRATRRRGGR